MVRDDDGVMAGPIEFSGAEIALILLVAAALFLLPAVAGGVLGLRRYRRVTPLERRSARGALLYIFVGVICGFAVAFLLFEVISLWGGI